MVIFCWIRHLELQFCFLRKKCLQFETAFKTSNFSWFTLISYFTHSCSVTPCTSKPGWNWAPYLVHCPLDDAVAHRDEDATQDGYQSPYHSSGYESALSVTAAHGGVRFPSFLRVSVCLLGCLFSLRLSVLVARAAACLCPGSSGSTGKLYHQRSWRS